VEWIFALALALTVSPRAWRGLDSRLHVHVVGAVLLGGLLAVVPIALVVYQPGRRVTRYAVAVAQMAMSAMLIHLSGGRIEMHFHVFGSLALLAFYRDWTVLVPATIVVVADHAIRGLLWPQSVYGVLAGLLVLADHAAAPGAVALAPAVWPSATRLPHDDRRPTLVALLHPQCPCSRATVAELQRLAAALPERLAIDVVLLAPADDQNAWDDAAMLGLLAELPGARVYEDPGGIETSRFGGRTSGQILLYGPDGRLRFAGGITPARGHEGSSRGADAIVSAVLDEGAATVARDATSPVFGCALGAAPHGDPASDVPS
jgi:hypothetical protein